MTKHTEWLELRHAIEFVGPLIFPEWTGGERHAPTPGEQNAEIRRLYELTPEQLAAEYDALQARIEAEAEQERAARKAAGAKPSGIMEGLDRLRTEIVGETDEARRRVLERTIESLSRETGKSDGEPVWPSQGGCERHQFIIDWLTGQIETAYQPGLAARQRWWETHAAIDDAGRVGRIRARACSPGLPPVPFGGERWRELFPPPGESMAIIDGIPAQVVLAKSDLKTSFAPEQSAPEPLDQRAPGRPTMLPQIMQEMVRRATQWRGTREAWPSWHREAASLAEWAKHNGGKLKPPKGTAIERELRDFYTKLQALAK